MSNFLSLVSKTFTLAIEMLLVTFSLLIMRAMIAGSIFNKKLALANRIPGRKMTRILNSNCNSNEQR